MAFADPLCAQVMVDTPAAGVDRVFDYSVPACLADELDLGRWVRVPFGSREATGVVVGVGGPPACEASRLREIAAVAPDLPPLTPEMILVARWMAEYYLCHFSQAVRCFLPPLPPRRRTVPIEPEISPFVDGRPPARLTAGQEAALHRFAEAQRMGKPLLLYGVADSGKTEVYLRAVEQVLQAGRQALFLVPEIALTPQSLGRVWGRFGRAAALWHHRMSAAERRRTWEAVRSGELKVVVGARSAVFAPFVDLGVIVIDEEHEPAFKQDETPRYHAREVALRRAAYHGAAVILGSATPSLESYLRAEQGSFELVSLPERVDGRRPPRVRVVDMRQELLTARSSVLSRALLDGVRARLARGEQAILFLNRRGMASFLLCRECGRTVVCPDCSVSLTVHRAGLICHYCGHWAERPERCPTCGGVHLHPFGVGTERVESAVAQAFPAARILRLDADSARRKGAPERILGAFRRHEADILIGTQMIAKGIDIPDVTLVGVICADVALHLPDFRAAERTFQLLAQVAGRAGRGRRPGEVIIQTYAPDHPAIRLVCAGDQAAFYRTEAAFRKRLGYPPYNGLIRLIWSGEEERAVADAATRAAQRLAQGDDPFSQADLVGPCPAPRGRIATRFRWHALVRGPLDQVRSVVRRYAEDERPRLERAGVALAIDVEPLSVL
ncbi:MAG TPA: primosomal protein N' [Limnochordia bacterium]